MEVVMEEVYIEQLGYARPTIVRYDNKTIISVNLSISELCQFWRQEFELYDNKVLLVFEKEREMRYINQKSLASIKTTRELFAEQGFVCQLSHQHKDKGE